jgi:histidyl-tRNA synthetase
MLPSTEPPRGLRDVFPLDHLARERIFGAWRKAAARHGFLPYEAPVVESYELLARKAGEEITDQIYQFEDKSGRQLALRPEVTPSLVRMIAARPHEHLFPAKWTTIAQCFRYERTGKGRRREHYQWNLDVIGCPTVWAEAWILQTAAAALKDLGLGPQDVRILVNHRGLLAEALKRLDVPEEKHTAALIVLDKTGKVPDAVLAEMLQAEGVSPAAWGLLSEWMKIKSLDALLASELGTTPAARELKRLFDLAAFLDFGRHLDFDFGVVRGLAYYTGIIFEAYDTAREFRAIFGGGRYDTLFGRLTGTERPAVGLGFGDVVIADLLAARPGAEPPALAIDACVGAFNDDLLPHAAAAAAELQDHDIAVDLILGAMKPRDLFAYASKRGAKVMILIAPDELARGEVTLKNLATRQQQTVSTATLAAAVAAALAAPPPPAG